MNSKVSIIMPAYNSENKIEKSIKSVLNQTYKDYELIIIDNGSKDNTDKICEKYIQINIKYYKIDIPNVSLARNYGIQKSEGTYITFLDSDDEFKSEFLQEMIDKIKESDLVTCGFYEINSKNEKNLEFEDLKKVKETSDKKMYLEILKENYLFNEVWNKIFKADIIKNNKIMFNEQFDLGEDYLFVLDYIKYVNKFSYLNKCLYNYDDTVNGLNLKYRKDKFDIELKLTKELEKFYKDNFFDLDYIYNRYGRVYYNAILNIYTKNNRISNKEKDKLLKNFLIENRNKFSYLKDKITDKKFKFLVNKILLKGFFKTKLFARLVLLKKYKY